MTDAKTQTQGKFLFMLSIACFYFMMPSMGIMTPTFSELAKAFPDIPFITITYIGTIVSLTQIVGAAIAGAIVGRKLKFKTLMVSVYILYIIAGCLPYVFPDGVNFTYLLIDRAIWGFALGLNAPIGAILVTRAYADENQRAKIIGFGMVFFNIGGLIYSYIGAGLVAISWQTGFLGHLVGIIGLIGALLLQEPADSEEVNNAKVKITPRAVLWPLVFAIDMMLIYAIFTLGSMVLENAGTPNAMMYQATGISMLTGIGIVMSAIFGLIYKALKKWVVAISLFFVGVGVVMVGTCNGNVTFFLIGWLIAGIGQQGVTLGLPMVVSTVVDKATAAAALGLTMAFMNAGGFLSTPWSQFISSAFGATTPGAVLRASGIAALVFAIIMTFITIKMKDSSSKTSIAAK